MKSMKIILFDCIHFSTRSFDFILTLYQFTFSLSGIWCLKYNYYFSFIFVKHQYYSWELSVFIKYILGNHDVIKWKHFPRCWPFAMELHRWPMDFPHKGQWRGALMFSLICAWTYYWTNNRNAGDWAHYDTTVKCAHSLCFAAVRYGTTLSLFSANFQTLGQSYDFLGDDEAILKNMSK